MKISKRQLNTIILEFLFANKRNSQMLNELKSVSGEFANFVAKDIITDQSILSDFNNSLSVLDDVVKKVTTSNFDDYLAKYGGALSKIGFLSGESLAAGASAFGLGAAVIAAYSIVPAILINTIDNLSTVEGALRNLRKMYDDLNSDRAKRVKQYGMDLTDSDFDSKDGFAEVTANLGIKNYGEKEMIQHLAAELIEVKDNKVSMKQEGVALDLLTDGVISSNFFDEIKKEFKRQKKELENAPEKLYTEMLEYIQKTAGDVKEGKSAAKQAANDFAKAGFDLIFPGSSNVAGMLFSAAADAATA